MTDICGAAFPMSFEKMILAVCVRNPKHRGDHSCHIRFTWPQSLFIQDGSRILTSTYRAVGKSKYIAVAIATAEREKRP